MGPLAVDGSTTLPFWVITTLPASTSRRAARRDGSINSRQSPPPTSLAASLGQMVASDLRASSNERMDLSSSLSTEFTLRLRQASEQYLTSSQLRSQDLRQVMTRPHDTHVLVSPDRPGMRCYVGSSELRCPRRSRRRSSPNSSTCEVDDQ